MHHFNLEMVHFLYLVPLCLNAFWHNHRTLNRAYIFANLFFLDSKVKKLTMTKKK